MPALEPPTIPARMHVTFPMNFAIAVHGAPLTDQSSASALRFVRAATAAGHRVRRVFFYHDGVLAANALAVPPQEEQSVRDAWIALAAEESFELAVCISTALKRGVVGTAEQQRYELQGISLHPAFRLVGLGQLLDVMKDCDRLITFAA